MADVHVWDGGSNTSPYDTFAKAATSFWTAVGYGSSSDDIVMADDHYEDPGVNKNVNPGGTFSKSRRVHTKNRTSGLSSFPASPQIENTGGGIWIYGNWTFENIWFRVSGDFKTQATSARCSTFRNCIVDLTGTGSFNFSTTYAQSRFEGGQVNSLATGGTISTFLDFIMLGSSMEFWGTSFTSNGATISSLVDWGSGSGNLRFHACDFSGVTCTHLSQEHGGARYPSVQFEDCEEPTYNTGRFSAENTYEEHEHTTILSNCGGGDNLPNSIYTRHAFGIAQTDRTIYRKHGSGSPDGDTYSLRIDGTTGVPPAFGRHFKYRMISVPMAADASEVEVEIARDGSSTPFTDKEVWIEVARPKSSNNSLIWDRGRPASWMNSASNWPTSNAKWEGLGGTNVVQTMSCTLTGTAKAGLAHIYVCFAVPSDGVNVCLKPGVS